MEAIAAHRGHASAVHAIVDVPMDGRPALLPGRSLYDHVRIEVLAGW